MSHIDIGGMQMQAGEYQIFLEIYTPATTMDMNVRLTKDEMRTFRDSLEEFLRDMNAELDYIS